MTDSKKSKPRKNETVGGGYFVFRRGKRTGRIGVSHHRTPFEHLSYKAAKEEAVRLAKENYGEIYTVFAEVSSHRARANTDEDEGG